MYLLQSLQTDYSLKSHVFVTEPIDGLFHGGHVFVTEPIDGLFYGEP